MDQTGLYGKGVFSTVRIWGGRPFLWEKHWRRLSHDAARLGIDLLRYDESSVKDAVDSKLAENVLIEGRARITLLDGSPSELWPSEASGGTTMSIITSDLRPVPRPYRVTVSPHPVNSRSPLAGVKSCNYLENILAREEAAKRWFHEAIRVNECGLVTSACMANVFWLSDDELCTPALSTGCLPGTTREFVMENLDCEEVNAEIEELEKADAIFLTSAGIGVVQVAEFNSRAMRKLEHPITDLLPRTR